MLSWLRRSGPPGVEDAARRLLILAIVVRRVVAIPPPEVLAAAASGWSPGERDRFRADAARRRDAFLAGLRRAGLWRHMGASERALIRALPGEETEQQR